jgi:hypothetical protein
MSECESVPLPRHSFASLIDIRRMTALGLRLRPQQDFDKTEMSLRANGGLARGGTPRNAEFSVVKTHIARGFRWNA